MQREVDKLFMDSPFKRDREISSGKSSGMTAVSTGYPGAELYTDPEFLKMMRADAL